MEKNAPKPLPRNLKTPIPLPRTRIFSSDAETQVDFGKQKSKLLYTNSFRNSLRKVTNSVQDKSNIVFENTKKVGALIERSVQDILQKRQTVSSFPVVDNSKQTVNERNNLDRCQSMPVCDIFKNITFGSPLKRSTSTESLDEFVGNYEHYSPPSYPPPPLPDESIYDEVHSSNASSSSHYDTSKSNDDTSYYEDYLSFRKLSIVADSEQDEFDIDDRASRISRADSWKFFNGTDMPPSRISRDSDYEVIPPLNSPSYENHFPNKISTNLHSYENFIPIKTESIQNIYSTEPSKVDNIEEGAVSLHKSNSKHTNSVSSSNSYGSARSTINSMYENWLPLFDADLGILDKDSPKSLMQHLDSVVCEFDPLYLGCSSDENDEPDIETTEEHIAPTRECSPIREPEKNNINNNSICSTSKVYDKQNIACSLDIEKAVVTTDQSNADQSPEKKTGIKRWSSMKKALKLVTEKSALIKSKYTRGESVRRSKITVQTNLYSGFLLKTNGNSLKSKEFVSKWCQLSNGKLAFSTDKNVAFTKDVVPLESILRIQLVVELKANSNGDDIFCWEISFSHNNEKSNTVTLGCLGSSERMIWMQKILESLTDAFLPTQTSDYLLAGPSFIKEGVSSTWYGGWICLSGRTLYYSQSDASYSFVDLRKSRCILEKDPGIVVDAAPINLYIRPHRTHTWAKTIRTAALRNGPALSQQQMMPNGVPTLVHKLINFVFAHGTLSEGIYRRNGSNSNCTKLLSELRKDAWSVHISRQEFSEYDVASTLKRFFRELPDCLLTSTYYDIFCHVAKSEKNSKKKIEKYKRILKELPLENYVTARKLFGHLHFIGQHCEINLMTIENLSAVWAPTLMYLKEQVYGGIVEEKTSVVQDLLKYYQKIFDVTQSEIDLENRMGQALKSMGNARPAGGLLKLWIGLEKSPDSCVSVGVSGVMTAEQVAKEAGNGLLNEEIVEGHLTRPIHYTELILETVLRWSHWPPEYSRGNQLILKEPEDSLFWKVKQMIPTVTNKTIFMIKVGELKYADPKSKSFKNYTFEFNKAMLCYYKDKACTLKLGEWRIEDIIWYIGYEPKRNPQAKNNFFGHTIAGMKNDLLEWISAMILSQFGTLIPDSLPVKRHNLI